MVLKQEIKKLLTNVITTLFALEIRAFFDKGGANNEIAFSLVKLVIISSVCYIFLNADDVTKVIIEKINSKARLGEDDCTAPKFMWKTKENCK
jgi:hypothetical protein